MDPKRNLLRNGWITLLTSLACAVVLALPGPAVAATDITQTANPPYASVGPIIGPAALGFSDSFSGTVGNTFLDHFYFTVVPSNNFTLTTNLNYQLNLNITNAQLWDSGGATMFGSGTPFAISSTTPTSLAPGAYDLRIYGNLTAATGSYGAQVNFNSATAPIPEPETYAMMLAGLGLMGFVARRRRQKGAA